MELMSLETHFSLGERLFFTLNISVTSVCKFLWWLVKNMSNSSSSSNVDLKSLYAKRKALSCSLFILLLRVLLWNIHIRGQYSNCDSMKAFITVLNLSVLKKCEILESACNLRLTFLHILDICSSKSSLLSIEMPNNLTDFFHSIFTPSMRADTSSS